MLEWKKLNIVKLHRKDCDVLFVLFKNKSFNLVGLPFYSNDNKKSEFEKALLTEIGSDV